MIIPIPTNKNRLQLTLGIQAYQPLSIGIKLYDPIRANTYYLSRSVPFREAHFNKDKKGYREIQIALPISPENLVLEVNDKYSTYDDRFQIDKLEVNTMPKKEVWAKPERHRFMDYIIKFSQKAGYVGAGFYQSPDYEFLIQYLPKIEDQFGQELVTPARIHRRMPRIQVSQWLFQRFSIPVRVAILSHEGCHFFNDTRSEKQADLCGIKYYLDYGFPAIEAVYAATKVFGLHPNSLGAEQVKRTRDIIGFIDHYKRTENQAELN